MTAIVLDTETTGLTSADRIIDLAISRFDGSADYYVRLDPGIPIPPDVTMIHGIRDLDVFGAPPFAAHADEIRAMIEGAEVVIGYNPWFDQGMIDNEYLRLGQERPSWPMLVCAKRLWDVYEPKEKRDLTNAYKRFVDKSGFPAHDAREDVRATRAVIVSQIAEFGLHGKTWEEIDPERLSWWGPSSHITMIDNVLMMNFGKHRGRRVAEVDAGFWRWVIERDFPRHVLMLALEMQRQWTRDIDDATRSGAISTWAREWLKP